MGLFQQLLCTDQILISPDGKSAPEKAIPRGEMMFILTMLAVALGLRIVYVFCHAVNTDEPQHLHVVWGWTQGLLQYRDVFDNHAPLFHILCAPLFAAFGERADIVVLMRFVTIPSYVLALWCTYRIGGLLFNPRVGLWACLLVGLFGFLRHSYFLLLSTQFRPDGWWGALWLLSLTVMLQGSLTWKRAFVVGLILGISLGMSIKTTLLLGAMAVIALWVLFAVAGTGSNFRWRQAILVGAPGLLGFLVVPAVLLLLFAFQRALSSFSYCLVEYNLLFTKPWRMLLFLALLPLLGWGAWLVKCYSRPTELGIQRGAVFLLVTVPNLAFRTLTPSPQREDGLALYPLLALFLSATIFMICRWNLNRHKNSPPFHSSLPTLIPALVVLAELGQLLIFNPPWQNQTHNQERLLADVVRLTEPGDYVMDAKGETIFRRRPFYYALERMTSARMRMGQIADTIPERLIATRTCVVNASSYPPRADAFIRKHYISAGQLHIAGQLLPTSMPGDTLPVVFEVAIPARYALVAEHGAVTGLLDGKPYQGARWLEAGCHEFLASGGDGRFAFMWAQAVERGFSPCFPP